VVGVQLQAVVVVHMLLVQQGMAAQVEMVDQELCQT
jgi:hypothetical protein